jgi:hypothetical protein
MDSLPRPNFDDNFAAADFKLALIERYCLGEIAVDTVQQIFDETPVLRAA